MSYRSVQMPEVAFPPRFPARRSNDSVDRATQRNLAWLAKFELLTSPKAIQRYADMGITELAMVIFPSSHGDGLDICVDAFAWAALFDDQFDRPEYAENPSAAASFVKEFLALTFLPPTADPQTSHPLAAAWADLWGRECPGMSPTWQRRAAAGWRTYMSCCLLESTRRARGDVLTLQEYLDIRRESMARAAFTDLIEASSQYELPEGIVSSGHLHGILNAYGEANGLINDVYSLPLDDARGEVHNAVLVLERERGLSRQEAIDEAIRLEEAAVQRWLRLQQTFPDLYDALDLGETDRANTERYLTDLGAHVSGNIEWSRWTGRYALKVAEKPDNPSWAADVPRGLPK